MICKGKKEIALLKKFGWNTNNLLRDCRRNFSFDPACKDD